MCWPMYPEQLQTGAGAAAAYHTQDGVSQFSPIHMETLQPILFPTDQYEHHARVGRWVYTV